MGRFFQISVMVKKTFNQKTDTTLKKPTFWDLQLCSLGQGWFRHSKCLKCAACLWFRRFSSHVKRCRHTGMQCFTRELKCPNQRQGAFLRHLKCTNHPGYEAQSCSTQKVGFSKWRPFFDSMHFRPWPLPSGGFSGWKGCDTAKRTSRAKSVCVDRV